ncbi:C-type lectin domain family 4 member K-like [Tachyglossus aculeatus]|uniref:C-type lectin domain family 4 member K-like n=1 Tax=Tachyglossus aculeatus TaxID=9261 RepID=UPI0018F5E704|nr:C-type lectin domain family 4 member K-like [Tachyglossus aculeatus]
MDRHYENVSFGQFSPAPGKGRKDTEEVYEDIPERKSSPQIWDPTPKAGRPAAHRSLRVTCAALVVLVTVLVSSLVAVTVLYLQSQRCPRDGESHRRAVNISTLKSEVEMLQGYLKSTNTALETLKMQHRNFVKKISQNWRFHGGKLYFFSKDKKTWVEAERFCVSEDSHLASVASVEEQTFLYSTANGVYHWIGLSDQDAEGQWRWTDGTVYRDSENQRFWRKGEPNNLGNAENCVHIWGKAEKSWNDASCNRNYPFICKWVPKPSGR